MKSREKQVRRMLAAALLLGAVMLCMTPAGASYSMMQVYAAEEDGVYEPSGFTFSGGTGKLTISCPEVEIRDGEAIATLVFSSSHISYVRVNEVEYAPLQQDDEGSAYQVPVVLDESFTILACTTAMSTPHEIEYTLWVSLTQESSGQSSDQDGASGSNDSKDSNKSKGSNEGSATEDDDDEEGLIAWQNDTVQDADAVYTAPEIQGLTLTGQVDFDYAEGVDIYNYEGGYRVISVHHDSSDYLLVPEGADVPDGLNGSMTVLQQPLDRIYVAATASMALFSAMDALDQVAYCSLTAENWYVQEAADAMNEGAIVYAGKYSAPDYELLLSGGCDLAVESTMILHSPAVKEKLEGLGIPVFVDYASYEEHPLGRTEWIKVYAAMCGMDEEAEAFFDRQKQVLEDLADVEDTGKTVAFFSVNSGGTVVVRTSDDYIPKMIDLAGGSYIPADLSAEEGSKKASVSITMEEFYAEAVQADYLVYNSTIESPITSLEELYDKNALFKEFKAVQEGHVWCTDKYLYQATDIVGQLIMDFHYMLEDGDESEMMFLQKIE